MTSLSCDEFTLARRYRTRVLHHWIRHGYVDTHYIMPVAIFANDYTRLMRTLKENCWNEAATCNDSVFLTYLLI